MRVVVYPADRRYDDALGRADADVAVFQRPVRRSTVEAIHALQRRRVAVVVEVDDDFSAIPPDNVAWERLHPENSPELNWNWLRRACSVADLVTVSTAGAGRAQREGEPGLGLDCSRLVGAR